MTERISSLPPLPKPFPQYTIPDSDRAKWRDSPEGIANEALIDEMDRRRRIKERVARMVEATLINGTTSFVDEPAIDREFPLLIRIFEKLATALDDYEQEEL